MEKGQKDIERMQAELEEAQSNYNRGIQLNSRRRETWTTEERQFIRTANCKFKTRASPD